MNLNGFISFKLCSVCSDLIIKICWNFVVSKLRVICEMKKKMYH